MGADRVRSKGPRPPGPARSVLRFGHRIGRRISSRHYSTAKAFYLARLRTTPSKDPILVYTLGKVGSTSVSKSLKASGVDRSIHHLHWLVPERLAEGDEFYRAADRRYRGTARAQRFRPEFVWLGEHLSGQINRDPGRRWQVITLARDPVARNVSNFFQNADSYWDYWIDDELPVGGVEQVARDLVALFGAYVKGVAPAGLDFDPLAWFDQELKPVFGVDVFSVPFPKNKGFKIYDGAERVSFYCASKTWTGAPKKPSTSSWNSRNYQPGRSNVGEGKTYAAVYRRFLELIRLPDDYLERMYTSKYSTHFYTEDELAGFRKRWRGNNP